MQKQGPKQTVSGKGWISIMRGVAQKLRSQLGRRELGRASVHWRVAFIAETLHRAGGAFRSSFEHQAGGTWQDIIGKLL